MTRQRAGLAMLWVLVVFALTWWWLRRPVHEPPEIRVERLLTRRPPTPESASGRPPEALQFRPVACPMILDPPERPGYAVSLFADVEGTQVIDVVAEVRDSWLHFRAPTAEGAGLVTFRGYLPLPLVWWTEDNGEITCHFPRDPVAEPVGTLRLVFPEETPTEVGDHVVFHGCVNVTSLTSGSVAEHPVAAGPCPYSVCRYRGAVIRCTEDATVQVETDRVVEVVVPIPYPPGAVGIKVGRNYDGALAIASVAGGSPADEAGLRTGLRIQKIDDENLHDLEPHDVESLLEGPDGDVVTVDLTEPDGTAARRVELTFTHLR